MRWAVWVHERLKTGSPPLRNRISNLPLIVDTLARELGPGWCQAVVETRFKAFNLLFIGAKVVARSGNVKSVSLCRGFWKGRARARYVTYSLKKAFAICNMRICGWLCS